MVSALREVAHIINVARPIVAILFADNILIRCLFGLHCFRRVIKTAATPSAIAAATAAADTVTTREKNENNKNDVLVWFFSLRFSYRLNFER